jgi:hypothetical protein
MNEELALKLIGSMKKQFRKSHPLEGARRLEQMIPQEAVPPFYSAADMRPARRPAG